MTPEPTLDESPFITIWDAPRETIRQIVARDPGRGVSALFFAAGAIAALDGLAELAQHVSMPPLALPLMCVVTGVVTIPLGHLGASYKQLVGRMLGGQATRREATAVAAWSVIPTTVGHAALWMTRFALYGGEVLSAEHPTMDAAPGIVRLSLGLAAMLFSLWSFYVSVVGFAEVNRFSIARSIATSVLAPLLVLAVGALVVVAVVLVRGYR
jgi:hypothetical protein